MRWYALWYLKHRCNTPKFIICPNMKTVSNQGEKLLFSLVGLWRVSKRHLFTSCVFLALAECCPAARHNTKNTNVYAISNSTIAITRDCTLDNTFHRLHTIITNKQALVKFYNTLQQYVTCAIIFHMERSNQ